MTTATIEIGSRVEIRVSDDSGFKKCVWWPKGVITGTVQSLYKNGNASVAVHQIKNIRDGGDGLRTLNFKQCELALLESVGRATAQGE